MFFPGDVDETPIANLLASVAEFKWGKHYKACYCDDYVGKKSHFIAVFPTGRWCGLALFWVGFEDNHFTKGYMIAIGDSNLIADYGVSQLVWTSSFFCRSERSESAAKLFTIYPNPSTTHLGGTGACGYSLWAGAGRLIRESLFPWLVFLLGGIIIVWVELFLCKFAKIFRDRTIPQWHRGLLHRRFLKQAGSRWYLTCWEGLGSRQIHLG